MQLEKLKWTWVSENTAVSTPATNAELFSFQSENNLVIPKDLTTYFKSLNGTNEEYDNRFFQFYSISQFQSIKEELKNWEGIPDYSNIVNTLSDYKTYFVFADFSFHMFSYAIKLYSENSTKNEVLVICGDEYKKIANFFSEFIELYLNNSIELQLNK